MLWLDGETQDVHALMDIARRIDAAGGTAYLVGGAVRDRLLHRPIGDHDFCVTGLTAQDFAKVVPDAFVTGKAFPVFRVKLGAHHVEWALARTEVKTSPGHTGFAAYAAPDVRIEEDLRRRDVTVNAMAVALLTGELVDPFGGAVDLAGKTLRAVSSAFSEDPLRVYRVARFAAQLGFTVEGDTLSRMAALKGELSTLSVERVFQELHKALLGTTPSLFIETLRQADVLDVHFPEVAALIGVEQPLRYHPEGDAYNHTLQVIDVTARRGQPACVRYAALVHDVGKSLTPRDQWPAHPGHEMRGVPLVRALSQRLRVPTIWRKGAVFATQYHMLLHGWQKMRPATIVDLYTKARRSALGVAGFAAVCEADERGRNRANAPCPDIEEWLTLYRRLEDEVSGESLLAQLPAVQDAASGKAFGEALRRARIAYVRHYLRARSDAPHMPT